MNTRERGRLRRFCGSGWTHASLLVLVTLPLWITYAIGTPGWWLVLLAVTVVVPPFLLAGMVSILIDRRRGLRSWTQAFVLACHAILVAECVWHWVDALDFSML